MELYIHIPFCVRKCNYCDFLSFPAGEETIAKYHAALLEEIRRTAEENEDLKKEKVETVFLGGGTPSLLTPKQIESLFACLRTYFSLEERAEITIEANPGTLCGEKMYAFREAGINRLSIGLQSTEDTLLRALGRIHTLREFEVNYDLARKAGFQNINIDLMSALPGQTLSSYENTLRMVLGYEPEHISSYSLILEEGTPFYEDKKMWRTLPDEDTERRMYERTKELLAEAGYERYEISNYALPGRECRHNIGYWDGTPYLGFGLGASSYYQFARFSNERSIKKYMDCPYVPFTQREDYSVQDQKSQMEDYMIFGLRMMKGVSRAEFVRRFGKSMNEVYGDVIDRYQKMGLLAANEERVAFAEAGIDVSNRVLEEFLL